VDATLAHAAKGLQTAVFSGGCFWGVQGVFEHVRGVQKAVSGYAGGAQVTANYELVSTGATGHAESVQVTYDPRQISYGELLRIFFSVATDPTQTGGQFPDAGSQYRTEVFYSTPAQASTAKAYITQLNSEKVYARPIVTQVDADRGFYPAELYHQDYLELNPDQPYIAAYDLPKVQALKALFPGFYETHPVTVTPGAS
jgi:peptide-methionine (S)-S-oxide reductase